MPRKKYALSPDGLWHILEFFTSQASKKQEGKEVRGKQSQKIQHDSAAWRSSLQPEHTQGDPLAHGCFCILTFLSRVLDIFESCFTNHSLARHLLFCGILYWLSASPTGDIFLIRGSDGWLKNKVYDKASRKPMKFKCEVFWKEKANNLFSHAHLLRFHCYFRSSWNPWGKIPQFYRRTQALISPLLTNIASGGGQNSGCQRSGSSLVLVNV